MTRTIGLEDFAAVRAPQARADLVYRAFDSRAPEPRVLEGESTLSFRQRVAADLKRHSQKWRDVSDMELRTLPRATFEIAEKEIYADALREARAPTNIPAGELIERNERDQTGRMITRFFGDPECCWGVFKSPIRRVTATMADR
jgi:hypothetical protein